MSVSNMKRGSLDMDAKALSQDPKVILLTNFSRVSHLVKYSFCPFTSFRLRYLSRTFGQSIAISRFL